MLVIVHLYLHHIMPFGAPLLQTIYTKGLKQIKQWSCETQCYIEVVLKLSSWQGFSWLQYLNGGHPSVVLSHYLWSEWNHLDIGTLF